MLKVILFLLVGFVIVAMGWLLAGIPGHISGSVDGYTIATSAPFAILMLVILVVAIVIVLRVLRGLLSLPRSGADWRRRRRVARGEMAVTRGLVELAAGQPQKARKEARRARRLLADQPQTLLLVAEAGRLVGRDDEAENAFLALANQKDARFLGLRGLLRQAVDRRDWQQAVVLAKQAEASKPGALGLRQQRAELALQTDNWAEASELIGSDPLRLTYYVAAANAETDPSRALMFAKRAWTQDRAFVPAALAYASRLRALGYETRAQSCIVETWKLAPHPDLAAFFLAPYTEPLARAAAAERLVGRNPSHPESRILLVRVALDAGLTREARHQAETAQAEGTHQRRLWLLLAEIEELERGDTEVGRQAQRAALRQAAAADPDPRWQCTRCHTDQTAWHPRCPVCAGVGTIRWLGSQSVSAGLPVIVA